MNDSVGTGPRARPRSCEEDVALLELQGIGFGYGDKRVLDGVSLSVDAGAHLAVIGRSGSGKSTLLRVIAGLEAPAGGRVLGHGEVLSEPGQIRVAPEKRRMAMVFQDLGLWPNLNAEENVRLGLAGLRLGRTEARSRAAASLKRCGIGQLARRLPGTLSGGEQQRVALARALVVEPEILLLDEPFTGLDLVTREEILQEVERLAREQGATLVVVTHDPWEAERLCEVGVVLEAGRVVDAGPLADLVGSSPSPIMARFRAERGTELCDTTR
ncbi:MAG: hypothetical protein DRJ65_20520 [Acidobacteria bacterium]|nr:MAG: hypothetical protein DRJ65_20520 [Acidobacteriota bacterium]